MSALDAFDMAEILRDQGWCVILKCLPKSLPFIIEGARSEYDAPSPDLPVAKGQWCCEIQYVGDGPHRPSEVAFAVSPREAVLKVFLKVTR